MPIEMLTLSSHPLCSFVQGAAIVLLEKGIAFESVNVDLSAKPDWLLHLRHEWQGTPARPGPRNHSTVTLFARLRGLSTSVPRAQAVWYASSCSGTT